MNNASVSTRVNRLAQESSPYLLQHAHNPVDWYPWGEEAFQRARDEDKPIFLSIGYSSCHWCHVMEKESFEDDRVAAILNRHFICIKVDREERPDVDEIYMTAVQMITGRGGWPLSVFLTPQLMPFHGGTYFPPEDRYGLPGFRRMIEHIADLWENDRVALMENAIGLTQEIQRFNSEPKISTHDLTPDLLNGAIRELENDFDPKWGGFGGAPKFPPSPALDLLLRQYVRTRRDHLLEMVTVTLDRMATGGIHDHLAGGFHRYSVDAQWMVPHFEKMLYDNALLSRIYLESFLVTGKDLYRRVAVETMDYVLAEMTDSSGGFFSAQDADSEGEEGKFYLWAYDEVKEILGTDASLFCDYYGITPEGNVENRNVLHLVLDDEKSRERLDSMKSKLLAARNQRVHPGRDEKIIAAWNGMMISSLVRGWEVLGDSRYRIAAEKAGDFICKQMISGRKLSHLYAKGGNRISGYLDDYANVINSFVDLYEGTFDICWLDAADCIAMKMIDLFWDAEGFAFFLTAREHESPIARTKPLTDSAIPSGNATAALALLRLHVLLRKDVYHEKAMHILRCAHSLMREAPRALLAMFEALDYATHPVCEIALVGDPENSDLKNLREVAYRRFLPAKAIALINPESLDADFMQQCVPLLNSKVMMHGKPTAYVCRNFTCKPPVSNPVALDDLLQHEE